MGLLDRAMSAMRGSSTPATPTGTPFPDLSGAQGATTAQAARATGGMSPEAAAYNAQPKGAFTPSAAPVAKPGLAARALNSVGNSAVLAKIGGVAQGGLAAKDMATNGVGVDNTTNLISGAAKFAGPVGIVGSTAFDVGKAGGKSLPDMVTTGLARAYNYVTGNGDRNRENLSTVTPNWDEIRKVAADNPEGKTAALLAGQSPVDTPVRPSVQTPTPTPQAAATVATNPSAPEDKFSRLVDQLSNAQSTAPVVRVAPAAASNYREPPKLDTGMVAGDATGLGTLAKINAQYPAAAEWAAGMKRAKNQDALQLQAEAAGDLNARAGDQLKMQGLSRAADIYAQQAQRQHERGLAMNKLAYDRANDTEKRYEKRIEDTFGPAFDKDGKANPNRQKFETALNSYLDQAGIDKRQLDPDTFEKIMLSSQSAAYNPNPGVGSQLLQKMLGGSTAATANSMDATRPTGDTALGGVYVKTADGRYKLSSDVHGGGVVTDVFNAPNREVQSRFAREAAAAKRRQEN